MPAVAAAVAGAWVAEAVGTAVAGWAVEAVVGDTFLVEAGGFLTASGIGSVVGGVAGGLASSIVGTALAETPGTASGSASSSASQQFESTARGALVNSSSNVEPIPIIYGTRRVGGARVVTEVSGTNNQYLNLVFVWSEGQISAVSQVYLDGVAITDARYAGLYLREDYVGTDAQAASATLAAEIPSKWNAACTLSGIAYTYLRLKWDQSAFPRGLPVVTADIAGRLLYDPRSATTVYSNNPALAVRDYLTNARYGRGIASALIDDTAIIAIANHCDATVSIPTATGTTTAARYTCDGMLSPDDQPIDNLRSLLTSCRGFLVFSGGLYKLGADKTASPVSFTLSEDNIVGGWAIQLGSKKNRFNRVRAQFFDPAQSWQPNFAVQSSSVFLAADNGLTLEAQISLPFTADIYRARQICQIEMKQSRYGIVVSLTATIAALQLEVGDVVPITHSTPGWSAKNFRVIGIELLSSDEVRLQLREYDVSVYTLDDLVYVNPSPSTNLPDPFVVGVPGTPSVVETLFQTTGSAGVKSRATITWAASADQFVVRYQVEYKLSTAAAYSAVTQILDTSLALDDLAAGIYNFRVQAINAIGVKSAYSTVTTQELLGLTAPPSNPANFAVQAYSGQAKFTWSKPSQNSDLDVLIGGRAYVRWSPRTSGATWDYGALVNPDGYPGDTSIGFGPMMTGTYMLKFCDSSGNYSVTEASFVATEALITGMITIATVTESTAFTGTKSNVAAVDGGIQLDSVTLIDSMATLMDSWGSIDSLGGIQATGSYAFASKLDLTTVQAARLFVNLDSIAFDSDDLIDSRLNNIDDWGLMDGAVIEDVEAQLMVRTTTGDPNGSPTWGPWHALGLVADYTMRGFDFRLDFASGNATHNRSVTTLSVTAKH